MSALTESVGRFRNPEYTGENRCLPCTVVNLAIAAVVSGGVALVSAPAAVVVLLVSLAAIYARGYLVPGTPTLTKRYLPDPVLRWFDKESGTDVDVESMEIETLLVDAGAIAECRAGTDLCLTDGFRAAWFDRIESLRAADEDDVGGLFDCLDVDGEAVSVSPRGDAYEAYVGDVRVGQWESRAAYLADVAAEAELRARYRPWTQFGFEERTEVLGALRLWLDRCPGCDGPVTLGEETVESCCRSIDVIAATCNDCGSRVFEAEYSAAAMAE
ncbi:MAG: hypothetical protein ABEJ82_10365 [Haloplanus sp.]